MTTQFQIAKKAFKTYCQSIDEDSKISYSVLKLIRTWEYLVSKYQINGTALAVAFGSTFYAKYITTEKDFIDLQKVVDLFKEEASQLSKDMLTGKVLPSNFSKVWLKNSFVD